MKHIKKICMLLICMFAFVMMMPTHVLASNSIDSTKAASLTIVYKDKEKPITGAGFDLYQVARITDSGTYVFTDSFAKLPVDIENISADTMQYYSLTLKAYAELYDIAPLESGATDDLGNVAFTTLATGLYLVAGESHIQDGNVYTTEPFLVYLPAMSGDANGWIYDVTACPKFDTTPQGTTTERKVLKVWKDDGNEETRPKDIVVHLLKDGEIYDTVKLNSDNNWRWNWSELDGESTWDIVEDVPEGYVVTITRNGNTYTCTNTNPGTPPPPPPKLPQTGQLWWPVPVLAMMGFVSIGIGLVRRRGG